MQQKITLLGTGTCQLEKNRTASSVLVEQKNLNFLYDIGRGTISRLTELNIKQNDIQHIILSHFHVDHVSDLLPYLHAASKSKIDPRSKDLNIYGPIGLEIQLMRILSLFGPDTFKGNYKINLHEIRDTHFNIKNQEFEFINLPPENNSGIKFKINNKKYALTGDSNFHQAEIDFLINVDFAIIDAGHPTKNEIIELAVKTQVPKIILSHLYQEINENKIQQKAIKAGYKGNLIVGKDLMSFKI